MQSASIKQQWSEYMSAKVPSTCRPVPLFKNPRLDIQVFHTWPRENEFRILLTCRFLLKWILQNFIYPRTSIVNDLLAQTKTFLAQSRWANGKTLLKWLNPTNKVQKTSLHFIWKLNFSFHRPVKGVFKGIVHLNIIFSYMKFNKKNK